MFIVQPSNIHGKGVFATQNIKIDTAVGVIHDEFSRYGLKAPGPHFKFTNHSIIPNGIMKRLGKKWYFVTNREVVAGEELTIDYTATSWIEQPNSFSSPVN